MKMFFKAALLSLINCFNVFSELNSGEHLQPAAAEPCSPAPAPAAAPEDGKPAGKQCKAFPAPLTLS